MPYNYNSSMPFRDDAEKAFGLAESALTALGFYITERTPTSLVLVGPGMNSTRQSPLVGATQIQITSSHGELTVEAELGGVERMSRFVTLFPLGLCLFLAIVLSIVFLVQGDPGEWVRPVVFATGGAALPWLVIGPLMARSIRARTCRALEALLANMGVVGESRES